MLRIVCGWLLLCTAHASLAAEPLRVSASALADLSGAALSRAAAAVQPANDAQLAAQVTGLVERVTVEVADQVSKGDLLVQLDAADFQLGVDQAVASLAAQDARIAQARERLTRARELQAKAYASADELLSRETDVAVL
ncbi:MAG: biotin/lipoyl-binding protein, partial [Pseudomonadota bacterium]